MLPNFFIVGPPKCASSSLHFYLAQHPEIYMSEVKETRFFDRMYEKGLAYYSNTFFKESEGYKTIGESTPVYSFLPFVANRIEKDIPKARLIFSVRNPIQRAYSGWFMQFGKKVEELDFADAIQLNFDQQKQWGFEQKDFQEKWEWGQSQQYKRRNQPIKTYLEAGDYYHQIQSYLKLFPKQQIKVIVVEELLSNPKLVLKEIYKFLGVDPGFEVSDLSKQNTSGVRKNIQLLGLLKKANLIRVKQFLPKNLKKKALDLFLQKVEKPPIPEEVKQRLIDYYRPSIHQLEKLLNKDFSHWLK